jgi:hypothetical protein
MKRIGTSSIHYPSPWLIAVFVLAVSLVFVFDSLQVGDLSTKSFGFRHENIAEMSMGMPTTP